MKKIATWTVLALATSLAGCTGSAYTNRSLDSVHQPVVQRTDFVLDVATAANGVSAAELDRLDGWFRSIGLRYGDTVSIDDGAGYAAPNARADVADELVGHDLRGEWRINQRDVYARANHGVGDHISVFARLDSERIQYVNFLIFGRRGRPVSSGASSTRCRG